MKIATVYQVQKFDGTKLAQTIEIKQGEEKWTFSNIEGLLTVKSGIGGFELFFTFYGKEIQAQVDVIKWDFM